MTTAKSSFVSLQRLKGAADDPAIALAHIRKIYFRTTRQTIEHDLEEALDLLKSLPDEEARERATVFMHGLSEMRREWQKPKNAAARKGVTKKPAPAGPGSPRSRRGT